MTFSSSSPELVGSNSLLQVYRKDLTTGAVLLVSSNLAGTGANGQSAGAVLSGDGTRVAWQSKATDMGAASSSAWNIYARDLNIAGVASPVVLLSSTSAGVPAGADANDVSISGNGSVVSFTSKSLGLAAAEPGSLEAVFVARRGVPGVQAVSSATTAQVNSAWAPTTGESPDIYENGSPCGLMGGQKAFDGVDAGHHALSADGHLLVYVGGWCRFGALGTSRCNSTYESSAVLVVDLNTSTTITLVDCEILPLRGANNGSADVNSSSKPAIAPDGSWIAVPLKDGMAMMAPNQSHLGFLPVPNAGAFDTTSELAVANAGKTLSVDTQLGLTAQDLNGVADQFVVGGKAVGRASAVPPPDTNNGVSASTITADGSKAVFVSSASNVITGDTNSAPDVFVTDVNTAALGDASQTAIADVTGLFPILEAESRGKCNKLEPSMANAYGVCADPVNTGTGNFTETFTDLALPGRGGGLGVTRSYNSRAAATAEGAFGFGWASNLDIGGTVNTSTGLVTLRLDGGAEVRFQAYTSTTFIGPKREAASLIRNPDGTLTLTRPPGETWVFSSTGQLLTQTDNNGHVTTYAYGGTGHVTSVTDRPGHQITITWDANRIKTVTDPIGRHVDYFYTAGDLTSMTNLMGDTWKYDYGTGHLLTTVTTPRQVLMTIPKSVVNTYDATGRVTDQVDQMGRHTGFDYTTTPGSTRVTRPGGDITVDKYVNGVRTAQTVALGTADAATTTFAYDPATLQPTSVTDPLLHRQLFLTYDGNGDVASSTDALSRTNSFTYDVLRRLIKTKDPTGLTTTIAYDEFSNVASTSTPYAEKSTNKNVTYQIDHSSTDARGDVLAVTNGNGHTWTYVYGVNGRRTASTDQLGHKSTVAYDAVGRILSSVSARGYDTGPVLAFTTKYTTDAAGRVRTTTSPLTEVTKTDYDPDGNVSTTTDAKNQVTVFTYDASNALTRTDHPGGLFETVAYDAAGRPGTVSDRSLRTTVTTYDHAWRPQTVTGTDGRVTTSIYDIAGRTARVQRPGGNCAAVPKTGCVTFAYDNGNQLTGVDYSDTTPDIVNHYDLRGAISSFSDGTGTTSYLRDSLGRIYSSTDGANAVIGYGWDVQGNLTSETYPGSHVLTKHYDAAERLDTVQDWGSRVYTYHFDANDNVQSLDYPSTVDTDSYLYDNADQLQSITMKKGAATLATIGYGHDPAHLTSSTSQTLLPGTGSTYLYDGLNQLTTADGGTPTYDAAGNLTKQASAARQVFDTANQLCFNAPAPIAGGSCAAPPAGSDRYSYDGFGNRTGHQFASGTVAAEPFNLADQMTGYTTTPGTATTYTYDARGLRQTKTTAGATTRFLWSHNGSTPKLLSQTKPDGSVISWIYGNGDSPLAQINSDGSATYFHRDQIGSVRLETNTAGDATAARTWDAYGKLTGSTAAGSLFGYAGSFTDTESGYLYLQARYYDPTTGQFLSRDPIGTLTGSPYAYIANSPVNGTDPLGLYPVGDECTNNPSNINGGCDGATPQHDTNGQKTADFAGGVLDKITFGQWKRSEALTSKVSTCSTYYSGGQITGEIILSVGYAKAIGLLGEGVAGYRSVETAEAASGALSDASRSAAKAAENLEDFTVSNKHMPWASGRYAKFAEGVDPNSLIGEALRSDGAIFSPNHTEGSFRLLFDFGRAIGTKGQTAIKVIVGDDGVIWTAYPVNL